MPQVDAFVEAQNPGGESAQGLRLRYVLEDSDGGVTRLAWSPDGRHLAVPSRDRVIRIHEGATGELISILRGHTEPVLSVSWSPDGRSLASGSYDRCVRVWDPFNGAVRHVLEGHTREVNTVAWAPSGETIASSAEDGQVILWRVGDEARAQSVLPVAEALHCAWSSQRSWLAVASETGRIRVWDADARRDVCVLEATHQPVVMLAWHPDGSRLASAFKDGTVRIWQPPAVRPAGTLRRHHGHVIAACFSSDGTLLASKARDDSVLLWRTDTWCAVSMIDETAADTGWCVALAFHPTAPVLASSGSRDQLVRIWDVDVEGLRSSGSPAGLRERMQARRRMRAPDNRCRRRVVLR